MVSKIIQRIQQKSGIANLFEMLSEKLLPSDLQSLMMAVYEKRANQKTPTEVFKNYQNNRFVQMPSSNVLALMDLEKHLYLLAKTMGFQPTEISPLAPLGACAVVATASQNKIISTTRNTEVVSDNTNVLALECAAQRKQLLNENPKNTDAISFCNSHRLVRAQPLLDPRHTPHFKIFSMVTAGRDIGNFGFEINNLYQHLSFYLTFFTETNSSYFFKNIEVLITHLGNEKMAELISENIFQPLLAVFPNIVFRFDPTRESGRGYYQQICFKVNAENKKGIHFSLADGGFTNWTQQYLNNKKERLLISGFGAEMVSLFFGWD